MLPGRWLAPEAASAAVHQIADGRAEKAEQPAVVSHYTLYMSGKQRPEGTLGLGPWSKGSRICGLCGEFRKMTRAHVPPQAAGNTGPVTSATVRVYRSQRTAGRPRTGGMWLRGLCQDCNSLAGENYDAAYGDFTARLAAYFSARTRLRLPAAESAPPVSVAPGRVARSVLIGMFATTPHLRTMFPSLACDLQHRRPHITMPDGATLRMALYPSRSTRLASMAYGLRILTRRQHYHVFSEIYFRPLAWALSPNEDRLDVAELGESAVSSWPVVNQWLQYGDDVTALDLRDLCRRGIPTVGHPLREGHDEWVETFQNDTAAFLEGNIPP